MAAAYARLWHLLIDRGMTKTEMRLKAGMSTSVLAKKGKDETVSMETLAKVTAALNCGLDDIVDLRAADVEERE